MIKLIEEFWETYLQARLYYSLDTPDLIIALDEMKVPLEVHSKWICVVGKIRHPWIMSHGFSKVHLPLLSLVANLLQSLFSLQSEAKDFLLKLRLSRKSSYHL